MYEIEVCFRPDEYAVGHVKPNPAANVHQKMIAALEIGAAGKGAGEERLIKAEAFQPDATLQIRLSLLSERRTIHGVEIVKDRPVRVEEDVYVLMGSPRYFSTNAEILLDEEKIPAEGWITAATDVLRGVSGKISRVRRRFACDRAITEGQIKLLGESRAPAQQNQTKGCAHQK